MVIRHLYRIVKGKGNLGNSYLAFGEVLSKESKQCGGEFCFKAKARRTEEMQKTKNNLTSSGRLATMMMMEDEEELPRSTISTLQSREEEIEKKKMEVREKVELQLSRAEEETRRLAQIWEELEVLGDPLRKEVAVVRKKIDMANRDLKPLGQNCQKKEKEYKEALEAFNEKNREKAQLVTTLMELLSESERVRMKKLEDLSKDVESIH